VNPIVRRVVVSATAEPEHLLEAINRGEVERYLLKPIDPVHLLAVIDELAVEYERMVAHRQRVVELQDQLYALRRDGLDPDQGELLERAELELMRARRYRRPLSLLVLPGAPPVEVRHLRTSMREFDIALRVGDRLVLVLPESDGDGARAVWDRLRPHMGAVTAIVRTVPEDGASLQALLIAK